MLTVWLSCHCTDMHYESAPMRLVAAKEGLLDHASFPIFPTVLPRLNKRHRKQIPIILSFQGTVFPTAPTLLQTRNIHANEKAYSTSDY